MGMRRMATLLERKNKTGKYLNGYRVKWKRNRKRNVEEEKIAITLKAFLT